MTTPDATAIGTTPDAEAVSDAGILPDSTPLAEDAGCGDVRRDGWRHGNLGRSLDGGATDSGLYWWRTPQNALQADRLISYTIVGPDRDSDPLLITDYRFQIPDAAMVLGVEVEIIRDAVDYGLYPVVDGKIALRSPRGESPSLAAVDPWPTDAGAHTYGGPTNTWGLSLRAVDVNDPAFGVVLTARNARSTATPNADVDAIRVAVYYCLR